MQKTLTTTALIFAGISGLMAANNITDGISGYTYTDNVQQWDEDVDVKGYNSVTDVTNCYWQGLTVNLKQDARYDFTFNITSQGNPGAHIHPIFNFYLAAQENSILFGNHYDVGDIGGKYRGPAGVYHYAGSVADGDKVAGAGATYILNQYCDENVSGAVFWKQATYKDTASSLSNTNLPNGHHTYRIIIEAFANGEDKIKFLYDGPTGDGWTKDFNLQETFGISKDHSSVDVGYYVADEGGVMSVDHASFNKDLRTLTPTVTPTPPEPPAPEPEPPSSPDVPEPSAFGLLAGLGAIALAASRRRRSR